MNKRNPEYIEAGLVGIILAIFIPAFYQGATDIVGVDPFYQMMVLGFCVGMLLAGLNTAIIQTRGNLDGKE